MKKQYDIVIIGAGGAGLSAALSAKELNDNVAIFTKSYPTHSQTVQAQGGINAVLDFDNDSFEDHINDTSSSAKEVGDIENIKTMCESGKELIEWLFKLGVPFSMNKENKIAQRKFGGTKKQRTCYSSDYTGLKILHTLHENAIKQNIDIFNEQMLLQVHVKDNKAYAITTLDIVSGELIKTYAKKIVIASGGYGGLYTGYTTNSYLTTGDGVAAAFEAGAKLSNMEFIQFHPTSMRHGNVLISESARGEGGYLVNNKGERFVDELKPRDEVARAIFDQLSVGNEVFLDLRHLGLEKINETMPQERNLALYFSGVKIEEELLSIRPAMHYCMGGIRVNKEGETSIKNLYACGEAAQNGVHGANRLGGNSLLEILVFGKIVGKVCATSLDNITHIEDDENYDIDSLFEKENRVDFYAIKDELGKEFFENIGLYRDEAKMNKLLEKLLLWKDSFNEIGLDDKSKTYNKNLVELLEFKNLIVLGEAVIKSALNRKESRGAHFRTDYKDTDKNYSKPSFVYKESNKILVGFEDRS